MYQLELCKLLFGLTSIKEKTKTTVFDIPNTSKRLIFKIHGTDLDVKLTKLSKKDIQVKFKELLGKVYADISFEEDLKSIGSMVKSNFSLSDRDMKEIDKMIDNS